ncbi:MAG: tetratricopeptide repeat protein [Ectothiorhodospiraceae bacterium]|nr:tetratricopeptide repeat protein [Ectothiorhodospiraceae bacterium]
MLQQQPERLAVWLQRGRLLEAWQRYTEAIAAYDRALGQDPNQVEAWILKGMAMRQQW